MYTVCFYFKGELNNGAKYEKLFSIIDDNQQCTMPILLDKFKEFLKDVGFSEKIINDIQIISD
jgi:hypothetical protein